MEGQGGKKGAAGAPDGLAQGEDHNAGSWEKGTRAEKDPQERATTTFPARYSVRAIHSASGQRPIPMTWGQWRRGRKLLVTMNCSSEESSRELGKTT